jgi:hypothetical protein
MTYELEFFTDERGRSPCEAWMASLDDERLAALIGATRGILAEQGIGVCGTPYGKHLGHGLCEFRIRRETAQGTILLRMFFHAYGKRRVVLLSGYDKGADPSDKRQQREIRRARTLLRDFREA